MVVNESVGVPVCGGLVVVVVGEVCFRVWVVTMSVVYVTTSVCKSVCISVDRGVV